MMRIGTTGQGIAARLYVQPHKQLDMGQATFLCPIFDGLAKSREGWKIIDYQAVQTIRRGEIVDPTQNMKASFSSDG
ncbi:MAG: hypothetical protein BA871_02990 [Desulfuromonadales bacterium C00003096]|nr:MAG: hypothetical protein BA871_02990 [Desulfuromonadales bacterium C00003096]